MPIRVHMFGLRLRIDCTQRSRNGQPAQSTTGTVRTSSIQVRASIDSHGRWWPNIASIITTNDSGSVHQKRRRKSDRKSVVSGKSVSVRGDLGGRRTIKTKTIKKKRLH